MISTAVAMAELGAPAADEANVSRMIVRATAILQRDVGYYLGVPASRVVQLTAKGDVFTLADDVLEPTDENPIVVAELDGAWEWQTVATTLYRRDGREFIHRTGWTCERNAVRVNYRSGYEVDAGPGELRDLVLRLVAIMYRASGETGGLESETLSDYAWAAKDDSTLMADWATTVAAFKRTLPI